MFAQRDVPRTIDGQDTMLKCCICLTWVHPGCIGDDENDRWLSEGPYTCDNCRQLSNHMRTVLSEVQGNQKILQQQQKQILDMFEMVKQQQEQIQTLQSYLVTKPLETKSTQTNTSAKTESSQTTETEDPPETKTGSTQTYPSTKAEACQT